MTNRRAAERHSAKGEKQPGDASFASSIGTNLKKLSNEEMAVLTRHGGALLAARIEQYAPELKTFGPQA